MAKTYKDNPLRLTARLGVPTGLRSGGVMTSANRKRDARRDRHATRQALRRDGEA